MSDFNINKYITKIQGRDYIEVKWRIVWFRSENPNGRIPTEVIIAGDTPIAVRASVIDGDGNHLADGMATIRQAEGRETKSWGGREIEKAETAAIGRALAHAGFGTQFTGEDEGENLADAPIERNSKTHAQNKQKQKSWVDNEVAVQEVKQALQDFSQAFSDEEIANARAVVDPKMRTFPNAKQYINALSAQLQKVG